MNIREAAEQWGGKCLSSYAALGRNILGRDVLEGLCDIRPEYQRDRDRIIHCKAFRRLKHKTRVLLAPKGDHYRTRLIHTLEVAQIARVISRTLQPNENLTEAIALDHDLGHIPFDHSGEWISNEIYRDGFAHYRQSIRVTEKLGKDEKGLNLTKGARDGILSHRTSSHPSTPGSCAVRLPDEIVYIDHDIDDATRAKIPVESDLSEEYTGILGHSVRERLNILIYDIIKNSLGKPEILVFPGMEEAMKGLRSWVSENAYKNGISKAEEGKARQLIVALYDYYIKHIEKLPEECLLMTGRNQEKKERMACDYIAGMSDSHIIDKLGELFIPKVWKVLQTIRPVGNVTPHRIM